MQDYVLPQSIEEAYEVLNKRKSNVVLGGCAFLKLGGKRIGTGVDLSRLNLNYINENNEQIEIGAMATFRQIETSSVLNKYFNGIIPDSVRNIIGVQFRNIVTVGATVYSRYGFSDLITALLALETDVVLYKAGRVSLGEFLKYGSERDILIKVIIRKEDRDASFKMMRNSMGDYAILNAAVSRKGNNFKIAVGARPKRAEIAKEASEYLSNSGLRVKDIEYASELASKELSFGSNMRGSSQYRQELCRVFVERAIMEVLPCR